MRLFQRKPGDDDWQRPAPPLEIMLTAIGYVRNAVRKPRPRGWEGVESTVELLPHHKPRLLGLDSYSHILVAFYMDVAVAAPGQSESVTLAGGRRYGIFATRSQLRPNHIGISAVELLSLEGGALRVRGLDAIDGTPVLDIKPYLPEYDSWPSARVPGQEPRG